MIVVWSNARLGHSSSEPGAIGSHKRPPNKPIKPADVVVQKKNFFEEINFYLNSGAVESQSKLKTEAYAKFMSEASQILKETENEHLSQNLIHLDFEEKGNCFGEKLLEGDINLNREKSYYLAV